MRTACSNAGCICAFGCDKRASLTIRNFEVCASSLRAFAALPRPCSAAINLTAKWPSYLVSQPQFIGPQPGRTPL